MALEGNGNYVFDGLTNYYKVSANSALNYHTSSASCHFGTAGCALNMNHQPSLQATAGGSFRRVNSSYSLDESSPFSVQALDSVNRGLVSEHLSQRNFFSSVRVQQPGIEQNCYASGEESSSFEQSTGKRKRRIRPSDEARSQAATVASPGEKNTDNESKSKRPKSAETKKEKDDSKSAEERAHTGKSEVNPSQSEQIAKPPEPPKDYIHVRARRGQATDSHSLAERVRREKISERMKLLQDLVPGCNKITGKAVMVDEIINYVQSLQCQVEFLSMKLEAVNPRLDFNMEGFLSKDVLEPSSMALASNTGMAYPQFHKPDWVAMQAGVPCEVEEQCMGNDRQVALRRIMNGNSPMIEGYGNAKISNVWDDELQNVVRLGVGKNNTSSFHI